MTTREEGWQPAVILTSADILRHHRVDPAVITQHAGERIRVRENLDAREALDGDFTLWLGCQDPHAVEVHPEDAERLWPSLFAEGATRVAFCWHYLSLD